MSAESTPGGTPSSDVAPAQNGPASEPRWSSKTEETQRHTNIATLLCSEQRIPTFFEGLTSEQRIAVGSSEGPPDKSEVTTGAYFSDRHTERMTRFGDTPRDAFLRRMAARLPEGVTVAIGGEVGLKQPGRGQFSFSLMRTYSRGEFGTSLTMSAGNKVGNALVSFSANSGSKAKDVLAGGSIALGKVSLQGALNLTDATKGTLAYEVGVSFPINFLEIDAGTLGLDADQIVEVSVEVEPAELAYDTFVKVLGPLTDYRNFVDPLSRY